MGAEAIAGEQVSAEEQLKAGAVKSAVAVGVSGQMDDPQASPVGQLHSRVKWFIDASGAIAQQAPPEFLQCAAHTAGASVSKGPIDVRLLRRMGKQRSASQLLDAGEMAGVIDVSMGEKNRPDVAPTEADLPDHACKLRHFAGEPNLAMRRGSHDTVIFSPVFSSNCLLIFYESSTGGRPQSRPLGVGVFVFQYLCVRWASTGYKADLRQAWHCRIA